MSEFYVRMHGGRVMHVVDSEGQIPTSMTVVARCGEQFWWSSRWQKMPTAPICKACARRAALR